MNKLPFRVTLLRCLVLIFPVWNILQLWTALAWHNTLNEFSPQPTALFAAVSGAIWSVIGVVLFWGVWQKKHWAAKLLLGTATSYTVLFWSAQFISKNAHPNRLFIVIVNLALLIFILFAKNKIIDERGS